VVEAAGRGGHVVAVPDEAMAEIGGKHLLRVKGALAGVPYRSNLAKMGGRIILGVHNATLAAAGKDTGDEVTVTVEVDTEPR
jgi:hypothetical protein